MSYTNNFQSPYESPYLKNPFDYRTLSNYDKETDFTKPSFLPKSNYTKVQSPGFVTDYNILTRPTPKTYGSIFQSYEIKCYPQENLKRSNVNLYILD